MDEGLIGTGYQSWNTARGDVDEARGHRDKKGNPRRDGTVQCRRMRVEGSGVRGMRLPDGVIMESYK